MDSVASEGGAFSVISRMHPEADHHMGGFKLWCLWVYPVLKDSSILLCNFSICFPYCQLSKIRHISSKM